MLEQAVSRLEVTIFVNDEPIVVHTDSLRVREILDVAGFTPAGHHLVELRGAERIEYRDLDQEVRLHEGARFEVVRDVYHIVVNTRPKEVHVEILSYEAILELANVPPPSPTVEVNVSYFDAARKPEKGTLIPGEVVRIKNGTRFNVVANNRS